MRFLYMNSTFSIYVHGELQKTQFLNEHYKVNLRNKMILLLHKIRLMHRI